jgi:hypothetical protein
LQAVECELEGYSGTRVWYRTNNTLGVMRHAPEANDKASFAAWLGRFVKRVEWPYKTPPPDITTEEGLTEWEEETQDLLLWLIGDGYAKARELAAGPQFQGNA